MILSVLVFFLRSLLITLALEAPTAFLLGLRGKKGFLLLLAVNVLTNPAAQGLYLLLWYAFPAQDPLLLQIPVEIPVFLTEILIYRHFAGKQGFRIPHPVLLGLLCNLVSFGAGVAMFLL